MATAQTEADMDEKIAQLDTITVPGLGEVPSPSQCGNDSDKRPHRRSLNTTCPVCNEGKFSTFGELRAHFAQKTNSLEHQQYELRLDDYV